MSFICSEYKIHKSYNFNLNKMTLTYYVINQQNSGKDVAISSTYTKTKKTVKLFRSSKISSSKTSPFSIASSKTTTQSSSEFTF